jgi:hypothetical protein
MPEGTASFRRRERVFVVRVWREAGAAASAVRASADDVRTREKRAFGSVAELAEFLRAGFDDAVTFDAKT